MTKEPTPTFYIINQELILKKKKKKKKNHLINDLRNRFATRREQARVATLTWWCSLFHACVCFFSPPWTHDYEEPITAETISATSSSTAGFTLCRRYDD